MSDSLRATVMAARDGDAGALSDLVAEHLPQLVAFVRVRAGAMLTDQESVHDLVQSVCREALADLSQIEYRGERQFRAWLFLLATRKIRDRYKFYRRHRRDVVREETIEQVDADQLLRALGPLASPSRIASAREELARIEAAISRLPEAQREAVAYVKLLGLDYREVGQQLDRSESAIRGLVARGLAALAEQLGAPS